MITVTTSLPSVYDEAMSDVAASRSVTSAPWGFTSMRFMPGRTKKL